MGKYQPFHDLPAAQYEALKADIAQKGVLLPIVVDEDGNVLDGHQRRRACAELHIDCPTTAMAGLSEDEKAAVATVLNVFRRHLSGVERSKAIQRLSALGWSQNRIAETVGVHRRTVGRVVEAGSADAHPEPPPDVDPETGEVVTAVTTSEDTPQTAHAEPQRVTGKDGKSYPAQNDALRAAKAKAANSDDGYRAAFSREKSKVREGLLTLDPIRVAEITTTDDRAAALAFARDLSEWIGSLLEAFDIANKLRSVK